MDEFSPRKRALAEAGGVAINNQHGRRDGSGTMCGLRVSQRVVDTRRWFNAVSPWARSCRIERRSYDQSDCCREVR